MKGLPLTGPLMGSTPFASLGAAEDAGLKKAVASSQCPHSDLDIRLNHVNFEDSNVHYLEVQATCKICGKPMAFRGMPIGVSPARPTMDPGGLEVRLPFLAEGEDIVGKAIGAVGQQIV